VLVGFWGGVCGNGEGFFGGICLGIGFFYLSAFAKAAAVEMRTHPECL